MIDFIQALIKIFELDLVLHVNAELGICARPAGFPEFSRIVYLIPDDPHRAFIRILEYANRKEAFSYAGLGHAFKLLDEYLAKLEVGL